MFIGHYSAALVLKGVEKKASLGWLFLAVQFVDILFFPLVLLGIERINIIENFTQSTHFELEYMPFTHSFVGSLVWAFAAYVLFLKLPQRKIANTKNIAMVMAIAVFSHWVLDLIVHTPDLPLIGDNSLKLGFGLWNNAVITFALETVLLLVGMWLYLRGTTARSKVGKYGMLMFSIVLIAVNAFNIYGPPPENQNMMAAMSLFSYFSFGGIAFWLDKKRS